MKTVFKTEEDLLKVLNRLISKQRLRQTAEILDYEIQAKKAKNKSDREFFLKRASEISSRSGKGTIADHYKKRKKVFSYSSGKLLFDPFTGVGTSYAWYRITKVIKKKLVLNVYRYSNTTAKHYRHLRSLLDNLGLEYHEIEAPGGLQDLESAIDFHMRMLAKAIVQNKHAKIKVKHLVEDRRESLKLVCKLAGEKLDRIKLEQYIVGAEEDRLKKLAENRDKPRILIAKKESDRKKAGLHFDTPNPATLPRWKKRQLIRDAKTNGFDRIYIHKLSSVEG